MAIRRQDEGSGLRRARARCLPVGWWRVPAGQNVRGDAERGGPVKISVCGKGGSGKSTIVALLAQEFHWRGLSVLVVDSDESNSGLYELLGLDGPPMPLMALAGGRKNVRGALRGEPASIGGAQEAAVLAREAIRPDDLPTDCVRTRGGVSLVAVGKIHQALEGCACPIGLLSREFLKRLRLDDGEVAIVDMEAGIEHFGRGIETSLDATVAVVEPSLESVRLAEKVQSLAAASGARFAGAVLNKVSSESIAERLREALTRRGVPVVGTVRLHPEFLGVALEGGPLLAEPAETEIKALAKALLAAGTAAAEGR
jgi:CO dehydrogenase maturation factor